MSLYERLYYHARDKRIISKVKRYSKGRDVFITHANMDTAALINNLRKKGVSFGGVIEQEATEYDYSWMGLPVYTVEKFAELKASQRFLISCSGDDWESLYAKYGLVENADYAVYSLPYYFRIIRNIDIINGIRKGKNVLREIKRTTGNDQLLICPYPGTGDAFLTGRYLLKYIAREGITAYRVITCSGGFAKILTLFGIKKENILVIKKNQMNNLKNYINYKGVDKNGGIRYLLYWGLGGQKASLFEGYNGLTFEDLFKLCVFKLPIDAKPRKIFQRISDSEAEKEIIRMGLIPNKTVVLAPYANSFYEELTVEWWENLARSLQDKDFCVATNSSGVDEPPIKGTMAVSFPYDSINVMMDKCGYFIGVRSGLCDILSDSNCRKIVIYQSFITNRRMEFFSLNQFREGQDLYEFKNVYGDGEDGKLMQMVLEAIDKSGRANSL